MPQNQPQFDEEECAEEFATEIDPAIAEEILRVATMYGNSSKDVTSNDAAAEVLPEPEVPLPESIPGDTLEEALARHGIKLSKGKIAKIDKYCQLLWEKNTHLNLTRHTDYEKFVSRDMVDSLHLAELLTQGEHVLDVGTGGGVPGIVLAILRPDLKIELCDATGKKAIAVGEIVDALDLDLPVWHAKGEDLLKIHRFQTLVIRAVARIKKLMELLTPYWHAFDRMLLVKGPQWIGERGESRHFNQFGKAALRKLDSYKIPGSGVESVILQICLKEKLEKLAELGGAIPPPPPKEERRRPKGHRSPTRKKSLHTDKKPAGSRARPNTRSKRSGR